MNNRTAAYVQKQLVAFRHGLMDAATLARVLTAEHRAAPTSKCQRELEALIAEHCAAHVVRLPNSALIAA